MGSWSQDPFDNDIAMDWLRDHPRPDLATLRATGRRLAKLGVFDIDDGQLAYAWAALIASAVGSSVPVPPAALPHVELIQAQVTPADVQLALSLTSRLVESTSELAQVRRGHRWQMRMNGLREHLGGWLAERGVATSAAAQSAAASTVEMERLKLTLQGLLELAGVSLDASHRARIAACTDMAQAHRWARRVRRGASADEILGEPPPKAAP